jgi:hypothetical protein
VTYPDSVIDKNTGKPYWDNCDCKDCKYQKELHERKEKSKTDE